MRSWWHLETNPRLHKKTQNTDLVLFWCFASPASKSEPTRRDQERPQKVKNCTVYATTTPCVQFNRSPTPIFQKIHNISLWLMCEELPVAKANPSDQSIEYLISTFIRRPTVSLPVVKRNPNDDDVTEHSALFQHLNCCVSADTQAPQEKFRQVCFRRKTLQKMNDATLNPSV